MTIAFKLTKKGKAATKPVVVKEEPKINPNLICSKCGSTMEITSGAGKCGTDLHCPNCNANITKVI